jgi:hypothetical protein
VAARTSGFKKHPCRRILRAMSFSYAETSTQTPTPAVKVVTRPDSAHFSLSVRVTAESATASIPLLRRAAQRLEDLLPPLGASLQVRDFDWYVSNSKLSSSSGTQLQATLVLPLAKDASFWDRAQKVAQTDDLLRALSAEGKRQKPALEVHTGTPAFVVADPEAHRSELVQLLLRRARSLSPEGELLLRQLHFERAVTQRSLSLEEVELSLPLDGVAEFQL